MGDLQCRDSNAEMGKGDGEIRVGEGLQAGQLIWLMSWGGLARLLYPGRQQTELLVVLAELLDDPGFVSGDYDTGIIARMRG